MSSTESSPKSQPRPQRAGGLVTGGSQGIGLACARRLQADGYQVAVTWRTRTAEPLEGPDGSPPLLAGPLRRHDPADARARLRQVEAALGPVEVLVCSAGITDDTLLLRMSDEKWRRGARHEPHGRVPVRASGRRRHGAGTLRSHRARVLGGRHTSAQPARPTTPRRRPALIGFARSLARELAGRNITVNVVAPGVVTTDMIAALSEERIGPLTAWCRSGVQRHPRRWRRRWPVLASDEAAYVTGAVIPVDGGLGMGH